MVRSVLLMFTRNGFAIKAVARDTNPIVSQLLWCGTRDLNPHEFPQQGLNLPPMPFG